MGSRRFNETYDLATRCLTWPETGCANRLGEGLFMEAPNGVMCLPCAYQLRFIDRDGHFTDRALSLPAHLRPYGTVAWNLSEDTT